MPEPNREKHERHSMGFVGNGPAGLSAQMDNWVNLALMVVALVLFLAMVLYLE
jgi:hypothetical protein